VAIDSFNRTYSKRKVAKRIFLITDGESTAKQDRIELLAGLINENDIKMNIMYIRL